MPEESIEVLLERVDGNVRHLRVEFDKQAAAIPKLRARVAALEKDRSWVLGAFAAVIGPVMIAGELVRDPLVATTVNTSDTLPRPAPASAIASADG